MTRAQVARRRFKSRLPRKIGTAELTPWDALALTMQLFVRLIGEMEKQKCKRVEDTQAWLVFCQPKTKGKEHILAESLALPTPGKSGKIGEFADKVMALDKPVFLGLLFSQHDMDAERNGDAKQARVLFGCEFTKAYDAPARLLAARDQLARGGLQKTAD